MEDTPRARLASIMRRQDAFPLMLRRWGGCWIDLVVCAFLLFFPLALIGIVIGSTRGPDGVDQAAEQWVLPGFGIGAVLVLAYFIVCETLWGRTLGKLITGTIVVSDKGEKPGVGPVILRTMLRLIEVNPFLIGGVPAGITVLVTNKKQRLGDLIASTYVLPVSALRKFQQQAADTFD